MRLNALLEKLERRIPPVLLSVYFPNILEPFSLIPHSFWTMNHLTVDEAGFQGWYREDGTEITDSDERFRFQIDFLTCNTVLKNILQVIIYIHDDAVFFCICAEQDIKEYKTKCSNHPGKVSNNSAGKFTSSL